MCAGRSGPKLDMNLYENLKLLDLVKDGPVRSYRAANLGSGATVLLHWLPAEPGPEREGLFRILDELPPEGRKLILEAGVRDGRPYVITECPIPFTGLREWLTQAAVQKGHWKPSVPEVAIPETGAESDPLSITKTMIYPILAKAGRTDSPDAPA